MRSRLLALACLATTVAALRISVQRPCRASPLQRSRRLVAQQQPLPPGWYTTVDPQSGQTYYCNPAGQCQMDPPQASQQGGAQQLPPGWYTTVDPQSGQTYYCNPAGQCQMDPPQASQQGGAQQLPPGWYTTVDPQSGQTYYCNEQSGQCQWDPPQSW